MSTQQTKRQCGECRYFHRPERRELHMGECRHSPPQLLSVLQQTPAGVQSAVVGAFLTLPEKHEVCGQFEAAAAVAAGTRGGG